MLGDTVKAYAELGAAALKAGEAKLYRLWLLARACDATGKGWLKYGELETYAANIISTQTLKRSLKLGAGVYWTLDARGRLWLAGLRTVAEHLDCRLYAHPVYIPHKYLKRLGDFNAAMLAAFIAGTSRPKEADEVNDVLNGKQPNALQKARRKATLGRAISRGKLADIYGRHTRTITAYVRRAERLGLLKVTPQAALTDLPPRAAMLPDLAAQGYFMVRISGRPYTAKRMPNRYTSELCTAAYGAVKQYGTSSSPTMRPTYRRLYYTSENSKGFTKALEALGQGEVKALYVATGGTSDNGYQLWHMYDCDGGSVVKV